MRVLTESRSSNRFSSWSRQVHAACQAGRVFRVSGEELTLLFHQSAVEVLVELEHIRKGIESTSLFFVIPVAYGKTLGVPRRQAGRIKNFPSRPASGWQTLLRREPRSAW